MKELEPYRMIPEDRTIGLFSEDCMIELFSEGYMIVLFSEVLYKSYCFHHKVLYRMDRIQLKLSQIMYINISSFHGPFEVLYLGGWQHWRSKK